MKAKLTFAVFGIAAMTAAPSFAADVVMEEPPAPAYVEELPGVSPWAGGYAGVTTGYGFKGKTSTPGGDIETDGINAGAFAGYQRQNGSFVYGVEADANYNDINGANAVTHSRTRVDGSLRARAGVAVNERILVYGTAGGAAGSTRIADAVGEDSNTMLGYTVGAGADVKLTDKVFARGEYRYTDYGSKTFDTGSGAQEVDVRDNKVLLGLGVKF